MIDSTFHVELNGKKYTLAQDAEGTHYQRTRETLRAPSNGFVLGDTNKFNLRPDLMEWTMTDWSGGEGQLIFDQSIPNAYALGYNIDPLTEYGTLRLSGLATEVLPTGAEAAFKAGMITGAKDQVFFADSFGGQHRVRNYVRATNSFTIINSQAAAGDINAWGSAGDASFLFYQASQTFRYDTSIIGYGASDTIFGIVNGYLYTGATAAAGLAIKEWDIGALTQVGIGNLRDIKIVNFLPRTSPAIGNNRLYIAANVNVEECVVYEITPTTAAGPGTVVEMFRVKGFRQLCAMFVMGVLFVIGVKGTAPTTLYYDPVGQTFGAFFTNRLRTIAQANGGSGTVPWLYEGGGTPEGVSFSRANYVMTGGPLYTDGRQWQHMIIDVISSATVGGTTFIPDAAFSTDYLLGRHSTAISRGEVLLCLTKGSVLKSQIWRISNTAWTANLGELYSALNDFGITDEKVLTSFTMLTDALPANCTVALKYQIDQNGTWITAGTMSTDNDKEETFIVSDSSNTRRFRNLQLKLELSNGGTTSVTPVVRAVRTRATVIEGQKTWSLILNATDELGQMQNRSWSGETLINNIVASADANSVITFNDGYSKRAAGDYTAYNVVIDDYAVINDRPGEGTVRVSLREII